MLSIFILENWSLEKVTLCVGVAAIAWPVPAHTSGVGVNRPGCFAEYIALPMTNIWRHDPNVDRDAAAIFDPFGNAVHTALSFDVLGEDVLITGAGPIGIMAAAVVRHAGARYVVITDVNDYRLDLARKVKVDLAINVKRGSLADAEDGPRYGKSPKSGHPGMRYAGHGPDGV